MSAIAVLRRSSNVFERWLISITDMQTPGSEMRSRCACSRTGSGNTAGPAEKLWIRVVVGMNAAPELMEPLWLSLYFHNLNAEDVATSVFDGAKKFRVGLAVNVDTCDRGLRASENNVLGFLHVQVAAAQLVENVREDTRPIAVTHDQPMSRRRARREVDCVWHRPHLFVASDDADGFGGNCFLCLFGGSANVVRTVELGQACNGWGK